MTDRFSLVPAAYVFLRRDGPDGPEVLLQLRQHTGFMDDHYAAGAAGHVERGETAYDAARREALEELGVELSGLTFQATLQRTRRGADIDERVDFFFTAESWTGEPTVRETDKCAELRWCRLDALDTLPRPVVPHERYALERLDTVERYLTFGFEETVMGDGTGSSDELSPRPEPETEEPEPNPGGPDAVDEVNSGDSQQEDATRARDLGTDHHPVGRESNPESVREQESEQGSQEPPDQEVSPEDEHPA